MEDKQALFLRLLEQIKWQHLPEEVELFENATIEEVKVDRKSVV